MKARLVYAVYATGWALVRALPEPLARRLFRMIADIAWRRGGPSVQRLTANLRRVVGEQMTEAELAALAREGMRSYLRYWMELFRLPVIAPERVTAGMDTTGYDGLKAALAAGRGAVVALPHTGNWDHAGAWAVLEGMPLVTVAEQLEPARLFDRFVAFRTSLGMEVLPLGGRNVFGTMAHRLRAGGLVCLVADRDLTDSGLPVTFFGATTKMPAGPAALAVRTGAALIPATLSFTEDGWHAWLHPEVVPPAEGTREEKVAAMTQAMADCFALGIAAHPQDWHMLQPLWLDDVEAPVVAGAP